MNNGVIQCNYLDSLNFILFEQVSAKSSLFFWEQCVHCQTNIVTIIHTN